MVQRDHLGNSPDGELTRETGCSESMSPRQLFVELMSDATWMARLVQVLGYVAMTSTAFVPFTVTARMLRTQLVASLPAKVNVVLKSITHKMNNTVFILLSPFKSCCVTQLPHFFVKSP